MYPTSQPTSVCMAAVQPYSFMVYINMQQVLICSVLPPPFLVSSFLHSCPAVFAPWFARWLVRRLVSTAGRGILQDTTPRRTCRCCSRCCCSICCSSKHKLSHTQQHPGAAAAAAAGPACQQHCWLTDSCRCSSWVRCQCSRACCSAAIV
jgi:hypothetical protein